MTKIISISTDKGGVGKSFFAVHLSLAMAKKYNQKVLLVELMGISERDSWLGMKQYPDLPGMVGLLTKQTRKVGESFLKRDDCNLFISTANKKIIEFGGMGCLLEALVEKIKKQNVFDLIIFDGSNCGDAREQMARKLSDGIVIPLSYGDGGSLDGANDIMSDLGLDTYSPKLISLAVTHRFSEGLPISFQEPFINFIGKFPKEKIVECKYSYLVDEAGVEGSSLFDYSPDSEISKSLYQLAETTHSWLQRQQGALS